VWFFSYRTLLKKKKERKKERKKEGKKQQKIKRKNKVLESRILDIRQLK